MGLGLGLRVGHRRSAPEGIHSEFFESFRAKSLVVLVDCYWLLLALKIVEIELIKIMDNSRLPLDLIYFLIFFRDINVSYRFQTLSIDLGLSHLRKNH